ncbi:unnamed protein product [Diatraea saccharalis]|uniref:MADF domain-containing protein n=1 Tax=Diatraea saccharalis TaxID=40085 RepID=A0A9N9QVA6_9NEOP|nr:unnamed protein product [Diatraea saccharalis]
MPLSNLDLIARVKDNPSIWMSTHSLHKNRVVLNRFWQGLAEEFEENETKLRKRWKHYKDQFRKEFKKAQKNSLSDSNVPWMYYKPLCFLKEDLVRKEVKNVARPGRGIKKLVSNQLSIILKRVAETKCLVEERLTDLYAQNKNDPDFLFLMSLMPSIKQLTDIQKLNFKVKINDWLLQEITLNTYGENSDEYIVNGIKQEH